MELQTAFYILGIIFMSIMLLLMIGLAIVVYMIKKKIDAIHRRIDEKINLFSSITHLGSDIVNATKKVRQQYKS
jgi:hypothetical protein